MQYKMFIVQLSNFSSKCLQYCAGDSFKYWFSASPNISIVLLQIYNAKLMELFMKHVKLYNAIKYNDSILLDELNYLSNLYGGNYWHCEAE